MWLHSNSVLDPRLVYIGKFSIQVFRVSVQRRWAILEKKESCNRLLPLSTRYSDVFCDLIMTNWQKFITTLDPKRDTTTFKFDSIIQSSKVNNFLCCCWCCSERKDKDEKGAVFKSSTKWSVIIFFCLSLSLHLFSKHCQNLWLIGVIIQALHSWTLWGGLKWFGNRLNKNSLMFPREGLALFHLIWVFFWP